MHQISHQMRWGIWQGCLQESWNSTGYGGTACWNHGQGRLPIGAGKQLRLKAMRAQNIADAFNRQRPIYCIENVKYANNMQSSARKVTAINSTEHVTERVVDVVKLDL